MRIALVTIEGVSPLAQGRPIQSEKSRDETNDEFEQWTWKERAHVDAAGNCFIPPFAFKNCIAEAAKYKGIKIPGAGTSKYTKHFESGILCKEPMPLGVNIKDVQGLRLFVPSDGKRGGGKRVWKTFPIFQTWGGVVEYCILDDLIDENVFTTHMVDAGQFIGVGSFRPRNNGYFGRFNVAAVKWK